MRRKNGKTIAASLALLLPAAIPSSLAAAQPPQAAAVSTAQHHRYFVEYRTPNHKGMQVKGPYKNKNRAHAVAHQMRAQGVKAHVVQR